MKGSSRGKVTAKFIRPGVLTTLLVSLLLIVTACGGGAVKTPTEPQSTPTKTTGGVTPTVGAGTATPVVQASSTAVATQPVPKVGGVLNRFSQFEVTSVDPHHIDYRPCCAQTLQEGFDRLIAYDPALDTKKGAAFSTDGGLAESWSVDSVGTTWTFKLRKGVKFHDGTDFSSADVVDNFKRILDPKWDVSTRMLVGFREFVTDVSASDDSTVQFKLKAPNRMFLHYIASAYGSHIVPSEAIKGPTAGTWVKMQKMIGTGPFTLDELDPRQGWSWKKNPNYWGKDKTGKQYPYLDGIKQTFTVEKNTQIALFLTAKVDVWENFPPLLKAQADQIVKQAGADKVAVTPTPEGISVQYPFNEQRPPFNNPKVIEAVRLAIDANEVMDKALGGQASPRRVVDPALWPEYSMPDAEFRTFPGVDSAKKAADRIRAKQLMTEAGYANGLTFEVNVDTTRFQELADVMVAFGGQLRDYLGIKGEYLPLETTAGNEKRYAGNWVINPENRTVNLAYPTSIFTLIYLPFSPNNAARHWKFTGEDKLNTLWEEYRASADMAKAIDSVRKMERIVNEPGFSIYPVGWIFYHPVNYKYVKNWYAATGVTGGPDYKQVWLEK